jgi:ribosome maturation factor RimP
MTDNASTLERLKALFKPTLDFMGFELYDLKLLGSGRHPTLRVSIDNPNGVTLDDCERVSKSLSGLLDQADPIATGYDLEVSSPGAERPLRSLDEYRRFLGHRSNIRYRSGDSVQVAEGRLVSVSSDQIELELKDSRMVSIPFSDILAARLAVAI